MQNYGDFPRDEKHGFYLNLLCRAKLPQFYTLHFAFSIILFVHYLAVDAEVRVGEPFVGKHDASLYHG